MPKNIKKNNFSLFGPKNITSGNILTQKYRTYLPVCACTKCPPPWEFATVNPSLLNPTLSIFPSVIPFEGNKIAVA